MKIHRAYIFLLIILFSFTTEYLLAQANNTPIHFKHLTTESGLSDAIVKAITQDAQGFMWIGTDNGLNRYDGYTYKNYLPIKEDSNSLSNSHITYLLNRNETELWVGTKEGLNLFNIKTGKSKRFKFEKNNPNSLSSNYIFTLKEDTNHNLWVGTAKGVCFIDGSSLEVKRYNNQPSTPTEMQEKEIWSFALQGTDSLWIGTSVNGLFLLDIPTQTFTHYSTENGLMSDNISIIFYHSEGFLLLAHWQYGLSKFNLHTKEIEQFQHNPENENSISSNLVNFIFQDNKNRIWAGTWGGGINLYEPTSKQFYRYVKDNNNRNSLINNDINCIFEDKTGVIWLGTWGGISYFESNNKDFRTLNHSVLGKEFSNYTKCIFKNSKNELWIGTEGNGVFRYDPELNLKKHYSNSSFNNESEIVSNYVYTLSEDYKGNIWVGTWNEGVSVINPNNESIINFSVGDSSSKLLGAVTYEIIQEGTTTWISTSGGINAYNHLTNGFDSIPLPAQFFLADSVHPWIFALEIDHDKTMWIGTDNGLFTLNTKTKEIKPFPENAATNVSINDKIIKAIKEDSEGNIWLATAKGLYRINKDRTESTLFDKSSGLAEENVQAFEFDEKGDVWVSTYRGISHIQLEKNKIWNYNATDGLLGNQYNIRASFKDKDGMLYFGGIEGINYFEPSKIEYNPYKPTVGFSNLKIFNKVISPQEPVNKKVILEYPLSYTNEVHLSSLESIITLEFSALHFNSPKQNMFQYRLIGLSEQWTSPSHENFATFTNLSAGTYILEVKAANNNGIWNNAPSALTIVVHPPWWRSLSFMLFWCFMGVATIVGLFYWRAQFFEKQRHQLKIQIDKQTLQLRLANVRLENQTKEIIEQNSELQVQKEELTQQHEELKTVVENLKNTQSKLVQAEKMAALGQLTAGIAHEINNPVNFINSGIVGLKKGIQQLVKVAALVNEINEENIAVKLQEIEALKTKIRYLHLLEMLEKVSGNIEIGAQRTAEIVRGLRTFSRQDSEKTAIVDLQEGINSTLVLLRNQYKNKLQIVKEYDEIPLVECYPGKVNQVFMNLISNAIDAIEPNGEGRIKISTKSIPDHKVRVTIEDNGKGMSEDLQEKVFEPFFTTKEVGKGTGLGLSITLGIMNDHHGEVEIESEPGKGTTFHLIFPTKQTAGIEKKPE